MTNSITVLIAPDKLRGTATADAASDAVAAGLAVAAGGRRLTVDRAPLSDGGEGFLQVLGGGNRTVDVLDPLGRQLTVPWRIDGDLAVIETALLSEQALRDQPGPAEAEAASSIGAGQLIAAAIEGGARRLLIGLGGSAFSDGGDGALSALEKMVPFAVDVVVACDVETGYLDAARVFGPQKGADPAAVERLSARLARSDERLAERFGRRPSAVAGGGAAGGLAGALSAAGAELRSGLQIVAERVRLTERMSRANLVITAEGRLDATSMDGKVVGGVIERAHHVGVPVWVLAGTVEPSFSLAGLDDVHVLDLSQRYGSQAALTDTAACLSDAAAFVLAETAAAGKGVFRPSEQE